MSISSPKKLVNILAISGSLRQTSTNTRVLRVISQLAPIGVSVNLYEKLGSIPPFNPDFDGEQVDVSVDDFRAEIKAADAVLICSPEYAHGVSGVMKNALDWLVSSAELMNKPIGLINASPRSLFAHKAMIETLTVMMAIVIPEASPTIAIPGRSLDEAGILADEVLVSQLKSVLDALAGAVAS
ncbi:NADPH-dependent FMN reductase [Spirosoma terrae]|uniref:NAD(P)H-dependent oxidoreductase n=1 Tax=Spirosoma terrae TaxID=1968276 RepID=A0A6L9L6N7_9BACT|nr:NADPH-dependent FMN reductase [Spirosoma terrae]NDU94463.1 NAD(P)H-dependent oxidoreductase [Spirosoma terrae]